MTIFFSTTFSLFVIKLILASFPVEPYVLGLSLFAKMVFPFLLLVFPWVASFCFGRIGGGVIFLRGMLSSLEEGVLGIGPLLHKL
jgi:hypothetical protein